MDKWLSASLERTSGWISGVVIAAMVNAIRNDTREMFICSAMLMGEYGYSGLFMSVPVILGKEGILEIRQCQLNSEEKEWLEQSIAVIRESAGYVEDALGKRLSSPT